MASPSQLEMERALPNALVPEEGVGFQVSTRGTRWTAAAGGFSGALAELVGVNDNEWGITGRLTYAPILGQRRLLHLGSSATHRIVRHARRVRFDTTPESHRAEVDLVETGAIRNVRDYRTLGWEAATVLKQPEPPDSEPLAGFPYRRTDRGEYRIIYDVRGENLRVLLVGKRNDDDIYKSLKRAK